MKRALFAVAIAALLPAVAMLAFNEISNRREREAELKRETLSESHQAAFEIERIIDGIGNFLIAVSFFPSISDEDPVACASALRRIVRGNPAISKILLIGVDGRLICSDGDAVPGTSLADQTFFQLASSRNRLTVGNYTKSGVIGSNVLPVALPIKRSDGAPQGILAAAIPLDWFGARLRERGLEKGGALTVTDRLGYIIARHPLPERFIGTRVPDIYLPLINQAQPGTLELTSQDGTDRILGFQPASVTGTDLYVSSGVSVTEAFASINRASLLGASLIAAGLIAAIFAAWFVGNTFISKPIHRIVDTLTAWRAGKSDARTGMVGRNGELAVIGQTVDGLLDELVRRQEASRQAEAHRELLMSELSHRVKNTLSIAISIANQMFKSSSGDTQAFSQRLSALAGAYDLLLADDWNNAEIHGVIEMTIAPHVDDVGGRLQLAGPHLILPSEVVLALSLVLHELATNAVKYGALSVPTGSVMIGWRVEHDANKTVYVDWRECNGPPVEPPRKTGFGSKLLLLAFPAQFRSKITIDYPVDGLRCTIHFQLPNTAREEASAP